MISLPAARGHGARTGRWGRRKLVGILMAVIVLSPLALTACNVPSVPGSPGDPPAADRANLTASGTPAAPAGFWGSQRRVRPCDPKKARFPRTATYYLDQHSLPTVRRLARYDIVVIDHEWGHRRHARFFDRLRRARPGICLFAYVNLVDRPDRLGSRRYWAGRYALWKFSDSTTSRLPRRWMARTAGGALVSEWPDTTMANLTTEAPRVRGRTFAEYAARWVEKEVWNSGRWDGIFLDVWGDHVWTPSHRAWDIDRDGHNERYKAIFGPGDPWAQGLLSAERIMRARMPEAILVANGDRTLEGDLNGRAWESFADTLIGRSEARDLADYLQVASSAPPRSGGVHLTINVRRPGNAAERARNVRFQLAGTLMQNGFWAPMGRHYGTPRWHRGLGPAREGSGYLGRPIRKNPTWEQYLDPFHRGVGFVRPGMFRRDFQHGIAMVNIGDRTRRITLERPYLRLTGERTRRVTLKPKDGIILLKIR